MERQNRCSDTFLYSLRQCSVFLTWSHPIPSHPKSRMSIIPSLSPAAPESQAVIWILLSPPPCPFSDEKRSFLSHSGKWGRHSLSAGGWAQVVLMKLKLYTAIFKMSVLKLPQAAVIQSPSRPSSVAERWDRSRKRRMYYSFRTYMWDWLGLFEARLNVKC